MLGSVRFNWFAFVIYDTIGVIVWAILSVCIGYAGGALFSDFPLLGMVVGVLLGSLVGFGVQKLQGKLFDWRDERRGESSL